MFTCRKDQEAAKKVEMKIFTKALNVEVEKQIIDEKTLKRTTFYHLAELSSAV